MGALVYYVLQIVNITRWYELIGICLLGLVCYICILLIAKEFTRKDLNLFLDTINIKKMVSYIWTEIRKK
jgi:hypothetical protein